MIAVPAGMRVLVATKPVDFRRGVDSLAAPLSSAYQRRFKVIARSPGQIRHSEPSSSSTIWLHSCFVIRTTVLFFA